MLAFEHLLFVWVQTLAANKFYFFRAFALGFLELSVGFAAPAAFLLAGLLVAGAPLGCLFCPLAGPASCSWAFLFAALLGLPLSKAATGATITGLATAILEHGKHPDPTRATFLSRKSFRCSILS